MQIARCIVCRFARVMVVLAAIAGPSFAGEPQRVVVQQVGGYNTNVLTGGPRLGAVVAGDYAYLGGDACYVFDISRPHAPRQVGVCDLGFPVRDIVVQDGRAYIAAGKGGLQVLDVSDPKRPKKVGSLLVRGSAPSVAVRGGVAFVGDTDSPDDPLRGGLRIIDIADPRQPRLISSFEKPRNVMGIALAGDYVLAGQRSGHLWVVDVSNVAKPQQAHVVRGVGEVTNVIVADKLAFVSDNDSSLHIIDIADPAKARKLSTISCDGLGRLPVQSQVNGKWRTTPMAAAGFGSDVAFDGRFVYVTGVTGRVAVIDPSDPTIPRVVGVFDTRLRAHGVAVSGNHTYINCNQGRLVVLRAASGDQGVKDLARDLVKALYDRGELKTVAMSLVNIGSESAAPLVDALRDPDSAIRMYAAHALSFVQPTEAESGSVAAAWIDAIKDGRGKWSGAPILYVRRVFMYLDLPSESRRAIIDALVTRLADADQGIRKVTTETLEQIAAHEAAIRADVLSSLRSASGSDDERLRETAENALRAIGRHEKRD